MLALDGRNADAKPLKRLDSVGHQTSATGLVDRRHQAIGDNDLKSPLPRGQGGSEASRSAANHKHIGFPGQSFHLHYASLMLE